MLQWERSHTETRAVTGMHDRTSRLMEWGNKAERGAKGKLNNHWSNRPMKCPLHAEVGFMTVPHTQTHTQSCLTIRPSQWQRTYIHCYSHIFFLTLSLSFSLSHTHTHTHTDSRLSYRSHKRLHHWSLILAGNTISFLSVLVSLSDSILLSLLFSVSQQSMLNPLSHLLPLSLSLSLSLILSLFPPCSLLLVPSKQSFLKPLSCLHRSLRAHVSLFLTLCSLSWHLFMPPCHHLSLLMSLSPSLCLSLSLSVIFFSLHLAMTLPPSLWFPLSTSLTASH